MSAPPHPEPPTHADRATPNRTGALSPQTALAAAGIALAIGLVGDQLLRVGPWGLNLVVWIVAASAGAAWLAAATRATTWWREARWYLPAVGFAGCVAWRDAEVLTAWNVLGTSLALLIPALRVRGTPFLTGTVGAYLTQPLRTALGVTIGPLVAASEGIAWGDLRLERRSKLAAAIAIGLLLALPLALVFGSLLASADPVFERLLRSLFYWDFASIASHTLLTAFLAWIAAGFLVGLLRPGTFRLPPSAAASRPSLGLVELGIPLGVLLLLFVTFVAIQARYLFGGEALVQSTIGMSYADYFRRGFFELIAVAGLLLPVLLAADWLVDRQRAATVRGFRILTGALLLLTLPMAASALERMRLYVDAYGLSSDRLYALSVMTWVIAALAWFAITVLRGNRDRFAFGAMLAGFGVLALLNLANPDRAVAQVNLARGDAGRELDVSYLLRLSGDGLPAVLAALPSRDVEVACHDLARLEERWTSRGEGWRRWNLGRARGREAVGGMDAAWAAGCVEADAPVAGE